MKPTQIEQTVKCLEQAATRLRAFQGPTVFELREARDATFEALQRITRAIDQETAR